ncbi:MAG: hypothetical protein WBP64_05025 [Nitrososphaeraceae archaeon]
MVIINLTPSTIFLTTFIMLRRLLPLCEQIQVLLLKDDIKENPEATKIAKGD